MNTYVNKIEYIESKVRQLEHELNINSVIEIAEGVYNISVDNASNYFHDDLIVVSGVSDSFDGGYRIKLIDINTIQVTGIKELILNDSGTLKKEINFRFGTPSQLQRNYKNSPTLSGYYFALFTPILSRQYSTNSNQQYNCECNLWIAIVQPFNTKHAPPEIYDSNVVPCAKLMDEFANICGVDAFKQTEHTDYGRFNKYTRHTDALLGANKAGVEATEFIMKIKKGGNDICLTT